MKVLPRNYADGLIELTRPPADRVLWSGLWFRRRDNRAEGSTNTGKENAELFINIAPGRKWSAIKTIFVCCQKVTTPG